MGMFANVVCKTVGVAGMSAALYDAFSVANANSKRVSQAVNADYFEGIHATKRTLSSESQVNNAIQSKITKMRENNPIVPAYGKVKGFCSGMLSSLGDNLFPVAASALALTTKGFMSKVGAWGVAGYGIFVALREGFGLGKQTPMD